MPEFPLSTRIDLVPSHEGAAGREQVMQAFNSAASRWSAKINRLHSNVDPRIEIDDLADTGRLTGDQRKQFADYRTFQKGVRAISGSDFLILHDGQRKDTTTISFQNPDTGEVYQREEGLDINGLITSTREDVESVRAELNQARGRKYSSPFTISHLESTLSGYENELKLLEDNSVSYPEAFPHALDENDPVEKARIAEEARRVWKNPLTATESNEGNRQAAKARLAEARLLRVPKKDEAKAAEVVSQPYQIPDSEPLPPPIFAEPWVAGGIPPKVDKEAFTTPEMVIVSPPSKGPGRSPEPQITIEGKFSELDGSSYASRFREFIIDSIYLGAWAVTDRIREFRQRWGERESRVDPVTAHKVDILMRTRIPHSLTKDRRLLVLPLVLALLAFIPKDSIAYTPSIGSDYAAAGGMATPGESKTPKPTEQSSIPTISKEARDLQNFEYFWENAKFVTADYTMRSDYKDRVYPGGEGSFQLKYGEEYSVRGMVESDIARTVNPELNRKALDLESSKQVLPEDDDRLNETVGLFRQKIDDYYGEGTYNAMVDAFTNRMKRMIRSHNWPNLPISPDPTRWNDDQIHHAKFEKWVIEDRDIGSYLDLRLKWRQSTGQDSDLKLNKWEDIRDEVNEEVKSRH